MALHAAWEEAVDRLAGSDPGLTRLRVAAHGTASMGVAILAEYLFVKGTGALQSPGHTAAVAAANHDVLLIAMLLGGMMGFVTTFGVNDLTVRRLAVSLVVAPVPMAAALAFGLDLGAHRGVVLASFAVFLGLAGLARRFGPRGTMLGLPLFVGDFIGFFLYGTVPFGDIGWLVAEIGVGALACALVRLILFSPDPARALRRSQRSWAARARTVARLAAEQASSPTAAGRLARHLTRLNEASLMIDARLAEPGALPPGSSARGLHDRLFDAELGLTNTARFAVALGEIDLPAKARAEVDATLAALRAEDLAGAAAAAHRILDRLAVTAADELARPESDVGGPLRRQRVLLHRFATSVALLGDSITEWRAIGDRAAGEEGLFTPAARLSGDWLPGSADVSAKTSQARGTHWDERVRLPPYVRVAVQLAVAVGAATAAGDALDASRFYWAVIAAFVAFSGVNTRVEQIRKAAQRVGGTVVGILLGSLVAHITGADAAASVVAVLVFLFLGLYLYRLSYGCLVIAVTVIVSQLYEQLHELTASFLLLRLAETAVGAGAALATVAFVFPLRTGRVLDVALGELLVAIRALVSDVVEELSGAVRPALLAERARTVDSAFQSLVTTAAPLRHLGEAGRRAQQLTLVAGALRHYCHNLTGDLPRSGDPGAVSVDVHPGDRVLVSSLDAVVARVAGDGSAGEYVRSASVWSAAEQRALDALRRCVASGGELSSDVVGVMMTARDFQLLDGALADLARLVGVRVRSLDMDEAPVA